MIRIVEHNDWVVYGILFSIFVFITVLSIFNRDANIKDFLTQKIEDSNNVLPSWVLITIINCLLYSIILSQFIPNVPENISRLGFLGYELNKFGFTFISFLIFYFLKNSFTFLFYTSIGDVKLLKNLTLLSSKYYFLESIAFIFLCFSLFFYPLDLIIFFKIIISTLVFSLILKNLIYLFHNQPILPRKWYYKFLYICTLQIVPAIVLWKYLFY